MKASSKICKGIKALLSQLRSEVSVKSKNRLIPKKCVTCFSSRPFGKLQKLTAEAFSGLLNHFSITVPDSIEKELFLEFSFWRCKADGSKMSKNCKQNAFTSKTHLEIKSNFGWGAKIHDTRKNKDSSLKNLLPGNEESVPSMTPSIDPLPQNIQSQILEKNVCLMDKSFFENFACHHCHNFLEVKDLISFSVNNLWGLVNVKCRACSNESCLTTVKNTQETTARYLSAIDSVGCLVSKTDKLFLCNDLLPPSYHHARAKAKDIDHASSKVATQSIDKALKEESDANDRGNLTVRGDFGWHNRANMKAQSGECFRMFL